MSSTSSSSRPLLNSNAQLPADTSTTVAAAGSSSTHDDVLAGAADPKLLPPPAAAGGSSLQIEAAGAGYSGVEKSSYT